MHLFKNITRLLAYGFSVSVLATLMATPAGASTTHHFQPGDATVEDVWVQSTHAGVSDDETLHVWKSSGVGGFKSLYQVPTLISAIVPSVTNSNQVTSATLNLYVKETEGGSHNSHGPGFEGLSVPIEISTMANAWEESNIIGGTPEAISFWNDSVAVPGSPITHYDVSGSDVNGWISLDVTDHVRSWAEYALSNGENGLPYNGFLIEAPEEIRASDDGVLLTAYHSSGATDASVRPYLQVTTVPVPAAIWFLSSGLLGIMGIAHRP